MIVTRRGVGSTGGKGEGIKMCRVPTMKYHGDVKCSVGNIVSNVIVSMRGVTCVLDYQGDHLVKLYNV